MQTVYISHPDYQQELCDELGEVSSIAGNMVFSPRQKTDICFALDVWVDTHIVNFESISEAVKILRSAGKFWFLNPFENVRRSRLIESELRKLPMVPTEFPVNEALPEIGGFSLLDKNTLVYSARRWKKPPLGHYLFQEDKINPPNRAYLKLWEALSLLTSYPQAGETVMDLGASPGGWTYVCQSLGANVIAVDKAPLATEIGKLPNITFMKQSAFAINPDTFSSTIDWLLCDVACYPERTYELISQWLASGKAKHFIFTIKLQGETDLAMLQKFSEIPNSRVIHLFQNKHEATFFYPAPPSLSPVFGHSAD
jgi:23S rRNA (cytidine2498-2'-O)-methyltransferase